MLSHIRNSASHLNSLNNARPSAAINYERALPENPLREGDPAPDFTFSSENWLSLPGLVRTDVSLKSLYLQKPLIIAFFSIYWKGYGINYLKTLEKVRNEAADEPNIIVVSAENPRKLIRSLDDRFFSLNFYYDAQQTLAERFGIFSEDRPVWNLFSGIDQNIPLLSSYVINTSGRISFGHIDDLFSDFPEKDLFAAAEEKPAELLYRRAAL